MSKPKNISKILIAAAGIGIGYFTNTLTTNEPNNPTEINAPIQTSEFSIKAYEKSKHSISLKQAVNMRNSYVERFKTVIKDVQEKSVARKKDYEPTEFAYMDIAELKRYLAFIDYVQALNPKNPKLTGIAINFGAYNLNKKTDYKGDYRGRLNVFFTPTLKENGQHIPVFLKPKNYTKNKYVGKYVSLLELYNNPGLTKNEITNTNNPTYASYFNANFDYFQDHSTSLCANELGAQPPRQTMN